MKSKIKDSYTLAIRFSADQSRSLSSAVGVTQLVTIDPDELIQYERAQRAHTLLRNAVSKAMLEYGSFQKLVIKVLTLDSQSRPQSVRRPKVLKLSLIAAQLAKAGFQGKDCREGVEFCLVGCSNRESIKTFSKELSRHGVKRFHTYGTVTRSEQPRVLRNV
ncbi:MAG: hypothetical protein KTR16_12280 [Acidiferrobacterales bacterium]|nr:hypothetical protein [Acidiferrobacterales bacterium]